MRSIVLDRASSTSQDPLDPHQGLIKNDYAAINFGLSIRHRAVCNGTADTDPFFDDTLLIRDIIRAMLVLKAHFDGKVFVPDEPVSLAPNQRVRVVVEPEPTPVAIAKPKTDWTALIGIGLPLPATHTPRYTSNDQLWEKD